jgi:intracellular sulfur oxidation DsrE/DsrF family protein
MEHRRGVDAAYLVLNDETYNSNRHAKSGNPYKKALNDLMAQGVQLELCGATAKANDWGNANLLSGIKVNVNAMVRLTQLEQNGYTTIYTDTLRNARLRPDRETEWARQRSEQSFGR